MSTYIITRITDRAGRPCARNPQVMQLGRRCEFIRQPAAGQSLIADYADVEGLLRIPHVTAVHPLEPDGVIVETADSMYYFEPAGQTSMLLRLAE